MESFSLSAEPHHARKRKAAEVKSKSKAKKAHAAPFALCDSSDEEEDDTRPRGGRFSSLLKDDDDRSCVLKPIHATTEEEKTRLVTEALGRIKVRDRDVPTEDDEHMEQELDDDEAYDLMCREIRNLTIKDIQTADEQQRIHTRAHLSCDLLRDQRMSRGDQLLDAIRKTLNNLGYTRSQFQQLFHEHFMMAILPLLYGIEWSANCERVFREFGIDRIRPEVLVQTPRRFGKTMSIALFCTAVLLNVPDLRICIFSTGKRASGSLMAEIVAMLTKSGFANRIVKQNQEQVRL